MVKHNEINFWGIYITKRKFYFDRLRIKANGQLRSKPKTVKTGQTIPNSYYKLLSINIDGEIVIQCEVTGQVDVFNIGQYNGK